MTLAHICLQKYLRDASKEFLTFLYFRFCSGTDVNTKRKELIDLIPEFNAFAFATQRLIG